MGVEGEEAVLFDGAPPDFRLFNCTTGAWRRRMIAATLFRKYYVRGDLPICVDHGGHRNAIRWKIRPSELDYHVYLPIFFDGLREVSACSARRMCVVCTFVSFVLLLLVLPLLLLLLLLL